MSIWRLILASLFYHRRVNLAVALGVCAATAVLTGALLVGDSMRGSLRDLALDRLGRVEYALVTPRFFRSRLADDLQPALGQLGTVVPVVLLRGTLENPDQRRRANRVAVIGCTKDFWLLDHRPHVKSHAVRYPFKHPGNDEIVLNQTAADELGLVTGGEVLLRFSKPANVPADSPLGRKTETSIARRLRVKAVVPAAGIRHFDLNFTQQATANAFVGLGTVQEMLGQAARVNALLVAPAFENGPQPLDDTLREFLRPTLDDYGLTVKRVPKTHAGKAVIDYFDITSDQMVIPPTLEQAITAGLKNHAPQPALTYLANSIIAADEKPKSQIPYSTVTAIDANDALGPYARDIDGKPVGRLADDEIVLTSWVREDMAANEVSVKPGDSIKITFFEPESTHGRINERSHTFRLRAIVPLAKPGEPPLATNDPDLTPTVPGVSDQASIRNWNAPFPFDSKRIRRSDDEYWKDHRTTPKAYISLAAGRRLWGSRFGQTTSIRVPPAEGISVESISDKIVSRIDPESAGFVFRPVREQALAASAGTTPFEGLFLGFSLFIIAAALMMVALLFRLGIEQRASEVGLLFAVGWSRRKTIALLTAEGTIVAGVGALLGIAAGIGYAALMLAGLKTWWLDAIRTPFLSLHVTPVSLAIGYVAGLVVSLLAIVWTLWRTRNQSICNLLANRPDDASGLASRASSRWRAKVAVVFVVLAIGLGIYSQRLSGEAQALAFFGAGALVLTAALVAIGGVLRAGGGGSLAMAGKAPLAMLAVRNAARNPGRSTLTIGLVASATFLIVAISAFRQRPTDEGAGGFTLLAQTDQPVFHDPADDYGREQLGFSDEQTATLRGATIVPLRVREGDDASCLNLYQPRQPRVIGAPVEGLRDYLFAWAELSDDAPAAAKTNPWEVLSQPPDHVPSEPTIPVVLDHATATYSMHLRLGEKFDLESDRGGILRCQIVGLLKNSIFQGSILMADSTFRREFPEQSGFRMFLVRTPKERTDAVATTLEDALGDYGFDAQRTDEYLAALLAVQNTYLSTFQSLGALGLLLGTFGLATVQLRSVFERRGELALLGAVGFRRGRLARLVFYENATLLVGGLVIGIAAAGVAAVPPLVARGGDVPWIGLAGMLLVIVITGLATGLVAVRATLRAPILAALRGE
jgi:putative ABC transport system permease protein